MALSAAEGFTVDRHLDGRSAAMLGAIPCGLVLQPLRDRLGPPGDPAGTRGPGPTPASPPTRRASSARWSALRTTDRVVAAGGWIEHAGLQAALRDRLGGVVEPRIDAISAARGAALIARDGLSA